MIGLHFNEDGYPNKESDLKVVSKKNLTTIIFDWSNNHNLLISDQRLNELITLIEES